MLGGHSHAAQYALAPGFTLNIAMPFVGYVHTEDREPRPEDRRPWEPNWLVWRWIVAAGFCTYAAIRTTGAVEALLVFVVFGLVCRAAIEALPDGDGLREYRQ
jgi:hypothetical protein